MRKNFLILLAFLILFFLDLNIVNAECYKYCHNGSCETSKQFYCYKIEKNKKISYEIASEKKNTTDFNKGNNSIEENDMIICISNLNADYKMVREAECSDTSIGSYVVCGNLGKIPRKIPELTSWFITIVEIIVPVILVIMGAFDFVKAITGQKEDEIKKGQQIFIKRLITGLLIFFIIAIVKLLIGVVSSGANESKNIVDCIECFLNNKC